MNKIQSILLIVFISFLTYSQDRMQFISKANEQIGKGNFKEALEEYNKAIKLFPNDQYFYYLKGELKQQMNDFKGAISDYNISIAIGTRDNSYVTRHYYRRGDAKFQLQDFQGALLDYKKSLELNPEFNFLNIRIGQVKFELKDYQGAIKDFTASMVDDETFEPYFFRGLSKLKLKNLKDAEVDFDKAMQLIISNYELLRVSQSENTLQNFEFALRKYDEELKLNANLKEYLLLLKGYANAGLKKHKEAIEIYTQITQSHENLNKYTYFLMALSKYLINDFENAIDYFNTAIELNPLIGNFYYYRGHAKHNKNDFEGAIIDYYKSIELNSNEYLIDVVKGSAYNNIGFAKYDLKDYSGAVVAFTSAIETNPFPDISYYYRGLTKKELKDLRGALEDFKKAIMYNFYEIEYAYFNSGLIRYELKDYSGAIEDFNNAIEYSPKISDFYIKRAFAKLKLSQKDGACLDFSKAGELGNTEAYNEIKKHCN